MLAERNSAHRPVFPRFMRVVVALTLGLAGVGSAAIPATAFGNAVDAPAGAPVRFAVAAPLVAPAGSTGLISSDDLAQLTSPAGSLSRQLNAIVDRPVAIGIDPMIFASIRVLGSAAPPSALAWLDQLASASNQTFALGFADLDLTAVTQSGSTAALAPQSFDFAVDPALFAPEVTAAPTPTPTATAKPGEPGLPAFPTTQSLLEWPYSVTAVAWPRENTVVARDLSDLGGEGATSTILSSGNVESSGGLSTVEVNGSHVVVSDESVSTALRGAAKATSDDAWNSAMSALEAALGAAAAGQSAAGQSGAQATVLATLDRTTPTTGGRLAQTLAQLASDGRITSIPLSTVIAASPGTATVKDEPQDLRRVTLTGRMLNAEQAEQQFASVAAEPLALSAPRRLKLLGLLSNTWVGFSANWRVGSENFLTESDELLGSVHLVETSGFTLLADSPSELPITVSNSLNQVVTVYITVRPDTGQLAVTNSHVKLTIEPNSQGKGQIPVQAISNGTARITVSLQSVSGIPIGASMRTKVNVQAGWETPIVVVFAILVVAVFGFGVVRSILRRRKAAATDV
jgi:hypothetical protein